jgi:hypothetical protein
MAGRAPVKRPPAEFESNSSRLGTGSASPASTGTEHVPRSIAPSYLGEARIRPHRLPKDWAAKNVALHMTASEPHALGVTVRAKRTRAAGVPGGSRVA